jgi:hypothetical protein
MSTRMADIIGDAARALIGLALAAYGERHRLATSGQALGAVTLVAGWMRHRRQPKLAPAEG